MLLSPLLFLCFFAVPTIASRVIIAEKVAVCKVASNRPVVVIAWTFAEYLLKITEVLLLAVLYVAEDC